MSTVLVVSGDAKLSPVVGNALRVAGFSTVPAHSAEDAWRALLLESPRGAIIDARQAGHWEFVNRIRGDGRFHALPVVVLIGSADEGGRTQAESLGVEYLSAPFVSSALVSRLRRAILTSGGTLAGGKVELDEVEVVVLLDQYRVRGFLHVPPEVSRFSDCVEALMRDDRSFLPLTKATISSTDLNPQLISQADLLQVRKDHIRLISPVQLDELREADRLEIASTVYLED